MLELLGEVCFKMFNGSGCGRGSLDGNCDRCSREVYWTAFGGHVVLK